ncbi:MAG: GNAT family N-acetyltransferase [Candidatus Hodarchaeota archaeon]
MIQQIPQKQLMDFWKYFENHKFRNVLAQSLTRSDVTGYVDNFENPAVVMFLCQQWACYLAGKSKAENLKDFLAKIPEKAFIYVPSQEWEVSLKPQWTYFGYFPRTELSAKSLSSQSIKKLLSSLPEGFQLKKVDVEVAQQILNQNFSTHWVNVINYLGGSEKFVEEGVGFCIQEGEKIASVVMGYKASIPITRSVEMDITTHPDYRGKGFATLVSAKLIEFLLKEGIEPHWDAANPVSVKLAQKLGFTDPEPYKCYYWRKIPWTISELKKSFDHQFERGLENISIFKSEISTVIIKKMDEKGKNYLLSRLNKTRWIFEEILLNISRFLETKIVEDSDILQFKEYSEKIKSQLHTLEKFKQKVMMS